jgi:pyruvate/2-oxoglutarate dehydrogenase complex dihydrolipoamide dehydrogenase (E3) component
VPAQQNEIWSARIAYLAHSAAQFGTMTSPCTTDMTKIRHRKRAMIDGQIAFHLPTHKTSGAELIMGTRRFVAPKTLEVRLNDGGMRVLTGSRFPQHRNSRGNSKHSWTRGRLPARAC